MTLFVFTPRDVLFVIMAVAFLVVFLGVGVLNWWESRAPKSLRKKGK